MGFCVSKVTQKMAFTITEEYMKIDFAV